MRQLRVPPTFLYVVGMLLLQAAWILTIPPFGGSDEFDHVYRATSVARGHLIADQSATNGRGGLVVAPSGVVTAANAQCSSLDYTGPDNCRAVGDAGDGDVLVASGASTYNPAFYWVVGTVARPFDGADVDLAMRVTGAVMSAGLLGFAAWALRRRAWHRYALILAVSPVMVYSTSVAAPNGIEMAAGLALWASLLAYADEDPPPRSRLLFWGAVVALSVLLTVRFLGPVLALLILLTMLLHPRAGVVVRRLLDSPGRLVAGVVVVLAVAAASVWWVFAANQLTSADDPSIDDELPALAPVVWAAQSIAAFPFRNELGPGVVYVVVASLVLALGVIALRTGSARDRVLLLSAATVAALGPLVLTELTRDTQGVIWQGRYGLPYSAGVVLLCGATIARKRAEPPGRILVWVSAVALAVGSAASLLKIRTSELGTPSSADNPDWWVPSPVLLCVLVAAAFAAFAVWALTSTDRTTVTSDEDVVGPARTDVQEPA